MNKRKYLSMLLAVAMVICALPVVGLAATNDTETNKDPLGVSAYSGDNKISVYYLPFEKGYNPNEKLYEVYIPSNMYVNNRVRLTFDSKHKNRLTFETNTITDTGKYITIQDENVDTDAPFVEVNISNKLQRISEKDALTVTLKTIDKDNKDVIEKYNFRFMYSVSVTTDVGENGKVLVAQAANGRANTKKSAQEFTSKTEKKTYLFDINDSLIFIAKPDAGYAPRVEGLEAHNEDYNGLYGGFVLQGTAHENGQKILSYPAGKAAGETWYILKKLKQEPYTIKINFVPISENITKIDAKPNEIKQAGEKVKVSLEGEDIDKEQIITVTAFEGDTPTKITKDTKGLGEVELDFGENTTFEEKTYTIKATMDEGKNWSTKTAVVKQAGIIPESRRITSVTAEPKTLAHTGGDITVKISGDEIKADEKVDVHLFIGDSTASHESKQITGKGEVTFTLPANTGAADIVYKVKATMDNAKAWSEHVPEVTVQTRKITPTITGVTATPPKLEQTGGKTTIKVDGTDLEGKTYKVAIFDGTTMVEEKAITGAGSVDFNLPANTAKDTKTYSVKVSLDDGATWQEINVTVAVPGKPEPLPANRWEKKDGKWYYYKDNVMVKGDWVKDKTKWYYLRSNGEMAVGWEKVSGKWYYLNAPNGDMKVGWLQDAGIWYYLNAPNGDMRVGWLQSGGKWYYLQGSGAMKMGWQQSGGKWYYLNAPNGDMALGWIEDKGKWYYLNAPNGDMATGTQNIAGIRYRFDSSGAWIR